MNLNHFLPIPYTLPTKQGNFYSNINIFLFLKYIRNTLADLTLSLVAGQTKSFTAWLKPLPTTYAVLWKQIGAAKSTWYAGGGKLFPTDKWTDSSETSITVLPFAVFDRLALAVEELPSKSRESVVRLYCYIYYFDAYYNHKFQRPQVDMAIELKTDVNTLNKNLRWLINKGFVERVGKYCFDGKDTFSYCHLIPHADQVDLH